VDEIYGLDSAYDKTTQGWLALVHPKHRDKMASYPERIISEVIADNWQVLLMDERVSEKNTLGLKVVNTLVEQLEGSFEMDRRDGTRCTVTFPFADGLP